MSSRSLRPSGRKLGVAALSATLGLAGLGLAGVTPAAADTVDTVNDDCGRLQGATRFGTAAAIADAYEAESPTDHAIIANGNNFPDALAASALSRELNAPILLVNQNSIPAETLAGLGELGIANVTIVGGPVAVSDAVEAALAEDYTVDRVEGRDRYETAAAIAGEIGDVAELNGLTTAIIATGNNYPDALAGGPIAYAGDGTNPMPILLTNGADVPAATEAAIDALGIEQVIILGGPLAVPTTVEAELVAQVGNPAIRLQGANREATAVDVAEFAVDELGFAPDAVLLADGYLRFPSPDALSGGPLGGLEMAPILLVNNGNSQMMPAVTEAFIEANEAAIEQVIALGGPAAVAVETLEAGCEAGGVPVPGETNQAFAVTPATAASVTGRVGTDQPVTFSGIDAATVDLALVPCSQVTVAQDGTVTFADTDGTANAADLTAAPNASITGINGVLSGAYPDLVSGVAVQADDTVNVVVDTTGSGCVVLVAFADADNDNRLDLDANNAPTEDFAVSGRLVSATPTGVTATPPTATNPYGEAHTVTAQLTEGTPAAPSTVAGVPVRFVRYADTDPSATLVCPAAGTATPVEVVNTTTGATGAATYTFNATDPATTVGNTTQFCVYAIADLDADGTFGEAGETSVVAQKTYTDAPAVAKTVDATPEVATNLFGTQHTVTATVTDQFGNPVAGDEVTFVVNPGSTVGTTDDLTTVRLTDASGVASFTYAGPADPVPTTTGTAPVTDAITVSVDNPTGTDPDPDEVAKTWAEGVATVDGVSYPTLEAAIAEAEAGDTITTTGVFTDDEVRVDESVIINGGGTSRLIGGFNVIADDVAISGFRVESGTVGIEVETGGFTGLTFSGNTITGTTGNPLDTGIFFNPGSTGTVSGNTIIDAGAGVATDTEGTVTVTGNTFQNNTEGIGVGGQNVVINGNTFTTNDATDVYVNAYVPVSDAYLNQVATSNTFTPAAEIDFVLDEIEPVGP